MQRSKIYCVTGLFLSLVLGLAGTQISAQTESEPMWQDVSLRSISSVKLADQPLPAEFRLVKANVSGLQKLLLSAPDYLSEKGGVALELPLPNGEVGRFSVQSASIMEPKLAAKYPQIQTFVVQGIDDPTASGRLDLTPAGFHGYIQSAIGEIYIDPYAGGDMTRYISYMKPDAQRELKKYVEAGPSWTRRLEKRVPQTAQIDLGDVKRIYQVVISATGEFVAAQCAEPGAQCASDDQTRATALAAIVTGMNRVNQIYERELSVGFVLVEDSDRLIFTDAENDPYSEEIELYSLLSEFGDAVNAELPFTAYDLGHVFGGGENAVGGIGLPFSCDATSSLFKLTGASTLDEPVGDPFWVDYVAHEFGHQLGAEHSYNALASSEAGRACTARLAGGRF